MRPVLSAVLSIVLSVGLTILLRRILAVSGEPGDETSRGGGRPNVANVVVVVMPVAVGNSPHIHAMGKRRHGGPPFLRKRGPGPK
jgi:hypothetical protein